MKDFIPYELAVKLKEKGFREKCVWHYYDDTKDSYKSSLPQCYNYGGNTSDAPTISQVLKWLRDEKKIHIGFGYSPRKKWRHVVMYMDDRFYNNPTLAVDGFINIEQAALAGIEYVLDILI